MTSTASHSVDRVALDQAVVDVRDALPAWRATSLDERVLLLRRLRRRLADIGPAMAAAAREAQGVGPTGPWGAESWGGPLAVALAARSYERVLRAVASGRRPIPPSAVHAGADGQVTVELFPATLEDRLLLAGYRTTTWLGPGVTPSQVTSAPEVYADPERDSDGVVVLLGAGNVVSLAVTDILHLALARSSVVVVKMNPVLSYQRPVLEELFDDFVGRGVVRFVDESVEAGAYLAHHPGVDRVHITGSAASHDALVWGSDGSATQRRLDGRPLLEKPVTSELGGAGPCIVVPGPWRDRDVRRQADLIAFAKLNNAGHVCGAPQVLVLPDDWAAADPLIDEIRRLMTAAPPRNRFYPGTEAKVSAVLDQHEQAEACHGDSGRVLVGGLDPDGDSVLFGGEVFADVLGVVRLPARSTADYLGAAVAFANERLVGTLAATMLVDPETARREKATVDRAIAGLRYGTIGMNEWSIMSYVLGCVPWGAYPGHTIDDVGSGMGWVQNPYRLPDPQKSLLSASFRPRLPMTSLQHRTADRLLPRLVRYLATDDVRLLPGVTWAALRG